MPSPDINLHQRLRQAADRLIDFYELRGDAAELEKWKAERAKLGN